ncbi:MAG: hypothetical protein IH964_08010 [Candidatus Dadabacteria bacterium]|nr:hypothetical protein [Candidatus Dadabacteria bacterium]
MNNKLSKSDIKLIADKFEWSAIEARNAVKEFLEKPSFANSEEILRICIDPDNPDERKGKIYESLVNTHCDDLAKHVCNQIVRPDPCFDILAIFIISELKSSFIKLKKRPAKGQYEASFYLRNITPGHIMVNQGLGSNLVFSLCYEYLDKLLKIKFRQGLNSESLLLDIVSRVGFRAFEITCLKSEAVFYSAVPYLNEKATRLARAIASPLDKKEITQRGYWLTYVIIERIRGEYGLLGAFRKLAEVTDEKFDSIQPRYFGRKKIAKEKGLTLDDIIIQYSLRKQIYEMEQKLEEMSVDLSVTER